MGRHPHLFPDRPEGAARAPQATPAPAVKAGQGITLALPFPPSLNGIWRAVIVRRKPRRPQDLPFVARVLLSARGRAYRQAVQRVVSAQGSPRAPTAARLAVTLDVYPPDRRKRDLSNLPKALEDALTHAGVWADDSLIDELHLYRRDCVRRGRVDVTITALEDRTA